MPTIIRMAGICFRAVLSTSNRSQPPRVLASPFNARQKVCPIQRRLRMSISRPSRASRWKWAIPTRASSTVSTVTPATASHSTWSFPQNSMMLSPWIRIAIGMTMNDAIRFAARTEVACVEIRMAPLTISSAWTVVSVTVWSIRLISGKAIR